MSHFDFTPRATGTGLASRPFRRPTAAMIVARWKAANRPQQFSVEYGETYAEFTNCNQGSGMPARWIDSGNGCRGVDRSAVVKLLMNGSQS